MPLALFGITNDGLNLFVNLLVFFLVVVWIALVAWTYLDAKRRIKDPFLVTCATTASLFPYVGSMVYVILRPPEFLEDAHERELEIRAAELRLKQLEEQSCPNCEHPIERNYLRCPSCRSRVKDPCTSCGKPVDPRWSICPYCESQIERSAPPPRTARPRTARAAAQRQSKPARQTTTRRPRPSTGRREGPGDDRPRPATAP